MDGIKLTQNNISEQEGSLLGAADIRRIAAEEGITPTKKFGQNFVIDPGTVKKIVTASKINSNDFVMEVGPGLGSLTLAILQAGANLTAVEIDPPLAKRLPSTVKEFMPNALERFNVILKDALELNAQDVPNLANAQHFTLVANLPYNVATPIILTLLEKFNNLTSFLVMVQKEVADRLCAQPGTKTYGTPSVKLAWYGESQKAGLIGRNVFWPAPNVDSALVYFERNNEIREDEQEREKVFKIIDAAFQQRRKTLHSALKGIISNESYDIAGIDPTRRGETLTCAEFLALYKASQI
ncbi:16S rRNA methyltransferase [Gardnerella vaginalis]|uniref:Ribosomal RNA small subunit methyltransferase A n=5 Tax=Gardnerella vaginalis TaxID=2702 RepID=A0AAP7E5K6_GARVA|nr:16S rRNA (adenine(1518)-N(6)/adenine(1519)-N(6))-dimethyltransferase RsmA [Gardnerella vaginalis]ADP38196.1 dimethyladenosine transferase [Gardnerella vaginalis ATCC 14019]AEF31838.1 dimethyladenosine transferase [Gardnerella vaginalis HMP9231]AYZ21239.1 16S rRNA (adenine(1518)-N(6)/adenine(1519)-N(6))-dimethyltransferase RsmA [Gardnerella vaginalis]EIK74033.1 dimethyladenosine transferase [Gardnerella vaginalis 284V]EIK74391.1 dimethyladenosine transferase [Gardnerella vaginalis 75712]